MRKLLPLLFLAAACGPTTSSDSAHSAAAETGTNVNNTWCHESMVATYDTKMVFDYEVGWSNEDGGAEETYATNVWLNVKNDSFQSTDQALAVVLTYEYGEGGKVNAQPSQSYQVPLEYESGRFTGSVGNLMIQEVPPSTDGSDYGYFYWELAVEVNGTWYKDFSGSNLRVTPPMDDDYCADGETF